MAHTAHKTPEQLEEHIEAPEVLREKALQLAHLIRDSNHCVFFTGAGISTSCGIPDFRGPQGVWTLSAKGQRRTERTVDTLNALPSLTHMAIATLVDNDRIKFLISQNVDGLHRRSGIPLSKLAELHGNTNTEKCPQCQKEYFRDYHTRRAHDTFDHVTGAKCPICGGDLLDTIINFGENLPAQEIINSFGHAQTADLMVCMGSSLTVSPANDMPKDTHRGGGKVVIINKQITPLDGIADLRIFGPCDEVMSIVMEELGTPLAPFLLRRHMVLDYNPTNHCLLVQGIEPDGTPASVFSSVAIEGSITKASRTTEPYVFYVYGDSELKIGLEFFGHYAEPPLEITHDICAAPEATYDLTYEVATGTWSFALRIPENNILPVYPKAFPNPETESAAPETTSATATSSTTSTTTATTRASGAARGRRRAQPRPTIPMEPQGMFAITPKFDCPHVNLSEHVDRTDFVCEMKPCDVCGDARENWLCLKCHRVFCSRYINQHMAQHQESDPDHCIAASFSDLSFWCFKCDSYIEHPDLDLFKVALEIAKFGAPSQASRTHLRAPRPDE